MTIGVRHVSDTIFALASGPGRAGVAVIRVSGPRSGHVCRRLTGRPPPEARTAALRAIAEPATGDPIDRGLVIWFPAPRSFTGEDVLELHVHGGVAVVAALCDALLTIEDCRPANPGEFSRRSFLNGLLDLTAAEGLADLISAETRQQARQALRQLDGEIGRLYERWRTELLRCLALIEAEIDFAADEEVPDGLKAEVRPVVRRLAAEIAGHLADGHRGERLREGLAIALIGPPNAGKSSLVNRLARRDVAIVTPVAGTTRDVIEVPLDLDGYPVTVLDMAGLRETRDPVELEGVRRAEARARDADIRLVLFDGAAWPLLDPPSLARIDDQALVAVNKSDLLDCVGPILIGGREALSLSCHTGEGIEALISAMATKARERMGGIAGAPVLTRARHRSALSESVAALRRIDGSPSAQELALIAEDLRIAMRALGRITGRFGVEDVLDRIFGEFCIGK